MKTKIIRLGLFLCLMVFAQISQAQQPAYQQGQGQRQGGGVNNSAGIIKGNVIDATSSQAIDYANIVLFRAKDSSMVNGTVTNEKGNFTIDKVPFGKYYLKITFIGYKTMKVPDIMIKPGESEKDLGVLKFVPSSQNLEEVTITTEKKLIEYKLDKKIVNVDKNITSTGGTAVDVLQNVPSVTVDQDGAVSLRGNSNVTILIDGRPSSLTGMKLQQIPASAIENVELITNPSARYNPEGMTGIININLKKKRASGLNGIATITAGTGEKYSGSVNLNYNFGKINLFGSYDRRSDKRDANMSFLTNYTLLNQFQNRQSESNRSGNSNNMKLGFDYSFTPKTTLTFSWMTSNNDNSSSENESGITTAYLNGTPMHLENYLHTNTEDGNGKTNDYTLNFRKTFSQKGREFTADVVYTTDNDNDNENSTIDYTLLDYSPSTLITKRNQKGGDVNTRLTMQANYTHPYGENGRLELGFQSTIKTADNSLEVDTASNSPRPIWQKDFDFAKDLTQNSTFIFNDQVHAIYGTYGNSLGKYSYQVGLRLEEWKNEGKHKTEDLSFNQSFFNFYPTVHLSRKFSATQEMQLSYSRRVNRPRGHMLNPFEDRSTPNFVRAGNPKLKQEDIHAFELGHSIFWDKTTINSTVFFRQVNDVISRVQSLKGDTTYITYDNQANAKSYGVELIVDQQILKWWKVNANFSYFKTEVNGANSDVTNSNYSWTSKIASNMFFNKKTSMQITGFYRGPMVSLQGEMKPMYSVDAAIKTDFWKDKMSASLRVSDIFKTMQFGMKNSINGATLDMTRKFESRVVYLSLSYKINEGLKSKQRKAAGNGGDNGGMDGGDF